MVCRTSMFGTRLKRQGNTENRIATAFGRFVQTMYKQANKPAFKMKRLPKIDKSDYHLVPVNPDPGFDPEKNKRVIEGTIKKYEAMRRKKIKEHGEQIEERSDALASYLKGMEQGGKQSDIGKYFGKKHLAYLRGQAILERIKSVKADS